VVDFDPSRLDRLFAANKPAEPAAAPAPAALPTPPAPQREVRSAFSRHAEFNKWFEDGFDAFRRADYQQALTLWERAASLNPDDGRVKANIKLAAKKLAAQPGRNS
jgi:hypothetical protein